MIQVWRGSLLTKVRFSGLWALVNCERTIESSLGLIPHLCIIGHEDLVGQILGKSEKLDFWPMVLSWTWYHPKFMYKVQLGAHGDFGQY